MEEIGVYIIPSTRAEVPKFSTEGSACFDIAARFRKYYGGSTCYDEVQMYGPQNVLCKVTPTDGSIDIFPGYRVLVPTGLVLDIPEGYSVRLHPRSGSSLKSGIGLVNSEGIIDSDFTNELMVMISLDSATMATIRDGDRICQGELVKNQPTSMKQIFYPPQQKTNRVGGFGSTGVV